MMLAECVTPTEQPVCQKEFYIPTDQLFALLTLYHDAGITAI
jgi:hypothetical protein